LETTGRHARHGNATTAWMDGDGLRPWRLMLSDCRKIALPCHLGLCCLPHPQRFLLLPPHLDSLLPSCLDLRVSAKLLDACHSTGRAQDEAAPVALAVPPLG
jgi:hypothetical protein